MLNNWELWFVVFHPFYGKPVVSYLGRKWTFPKGSTNILLLNISSIFYFLLQQDHGFDMMGVGEHVHGLELFDGKAGLNELAQVPAQGGGVAGDINETFTGEGGKAGGKSWCALSGWVDEDAVKNFPFCCQCPATGMDGAFLEQGVGEACLFAVFSGAADGRALALDAQQRC